MQIGFSIYFHVQGGFNLRAQGHTIDQSARFSLCKLLFAAGKGVVKGGEKGKMELTSN